MANLSNMVILKRSLVSRAGQNLETTKIAWRLWETAIREKPYMGECFQDKAGNDMWPVEEQFWLKYKLQFQRMGFLPPTVEEMKKSF